MTAGEFFDVRVRANRVEVFGDLRLNSLPRLSSCLYQVVERAGYRDVCIDLSSLTSITSSVIPPVAAYLRFLVRDRNVEFDLIEPRSRQLSERISKLGLAHYVEHRRFPKPKLSSSGPSVLQFLDHDERVFAVDKVLNSALRTTDLGRPQLAALEWAVNEITDNVITHSDSKVGGFIICHKMAVKNILEFTVADAGIGIARSLGVIDDTEAVEKAIQEGVTRNKVTNQGNGLYGTFRLALASAGVFVLKSGYGNLFVGKDGSTHIHKDSIPYKGTFVVCQIDCAKPSLISNALQFRGSIHNPSFDYIERKHEFENGVVKVHAKDICSTFGSRQSGIEARRYINNVIGSEQDATIEIDFSDVFVVSSSYADEVFGKMFLEMGPLQYMRRVRLINVVGDIEGLIDRAITLRSRTGLQPDSDS